MKVSQLLMEVWGLGSSCQTQRSGCKKESLPCEISPDSQPRTTQPGQFELSSFMINGSIVQPIVKDGTLRFEVITGELDS